MPKFSSRLRSAVIHGMQGFTIWFFGGILIEGALNIMGALTLYGIPQFTIPAILGAWGFLNPVAYEASRQLDQEDK